MTSTRFALVVLLASAAVFSACGKRDQPSPTTTTPAAIGVDPLAGFQAIVNRCQTALANPDPVRLLKMEQGGKWIRVVTSPYTISYDVRKTDSLVAPYGALIDLSFQRVLITRESEESARSAPMESPVSGDILEKNRFLLKYSYLDQSWKLTSVQQSLSTAMGVNVDVPLREAPKEDFLKEVKNGSACTSS